MVRRISFFRCEILSSFSEVIEVARSEGGVDHEKSIGKGVGIRCFLSCGQPHHLLFHGLLEGWLGAYWNHGWVLIGIMAGTYYAFLRWPFEPDLSEYFE